MMALRPHLSRIFLCLMAAGGTKAQICSALNQCAVEGDFYSDNRCFWFFQRVSSKWCDDQCCETDFLDCCEANEGRMTFAAIVVIAVVVVLILLSCISCRCCILHDCLQKCLCFCSQNKKNGTDKGFEDDFEDEIETRYPPAFVTTESVAGKSRNTV